MALIPPIPALPVFGKSKKGLFRPLDTLPRRGNADALPSGTLPPGSVPPSPPLQVQVSPLHAVAVPTPLVAGVASSPGSQAPAWRNDLLTERPAWSEADLVRQASACPQDDLDRPLGLNLTTALLDACRLGLLTLAAAVLDRGARATATTVQGLSTVDLLVIAGEEDRPQQRPTGPDSPPVVEGVIGLLSQPSETQLRLVERLLDAGATFSPDMLPMLASMPLGIKLEQRALRATLAAASPSSPRSQGPSRARL